MSYRKTHMGWVSVCLIGLLSATVPLAAAAPVRAAAPAAFPSRGKVHRTISQYMDGLANREEMDLLSRGDILPLFAALELIGWEMTKKSKAEVESRLLKDSDWLVRTLRTRKGTRFMRDFSSFPDGYDRVDRMRQNPNGKKELLGLINSPGGAKLIEYLTTTKQGRRTGADLSSPHGGGKFNTPTHRLYTKADVSELIKQLYAAEAAQRAQATSVSKTRPARSPPAKAKSLRSKPSRSQRKRPTPTESTSEPIEE